MERGDERQDGWQPMDTAPKGQFDSVIVCSGGTVGEAYWAEAVAYWPEDPRCDEPAGWHWAGTGCRSGRINREPEGWMPLPDPPVASAPSE